MSVDNNNVHVGLLTIITQVARSFYLPAIPFSGDRGAAELANSPDE